MQRRVSIGVGLLLVVIAALFAWRSGGGSSGPSSAKPSSTSAARSSSAIGKRARVSGPTAPGSLVGRVTRASDGAGIPGAVVSIAPAELMAMIIKSDAPTIIAVTDASGAWTASSVRPGAYVVAATATGYLPGSRAKLTVAIGEPRTGIDLALAAGGTVVRGTVTDVGGGPIDDARITANGSRMPELFGRADFVAITGADGHYELTLPDGDFKIVARHDEYRSEHENVEVAGTPLTIDFKLVPGAVMRGQVIALDSNKPVPGALVIARGGSGGGEGTTIADDHGNFMLHSLAPGALELLALGRGYASATPTSVAVGIGEQVEGVRLLVDRAYSISGRVVRKGKPSEGLAAITLGAFSFATKSFGLALEPSTDDGSFEILGLKRGSYIVGAVGEGSVPEVGKTVEIVDKDVEGLTLELDAGVTLAGRVEPAMAGVQLTIKPAASIGFANMFEAVKAALVHGETDASGAFTLRNVPPGAFGLEAAASDGRAGSTPVLVAGTDQGGLLVKLEARASVSGRVVDTGGKPAAGIEVDARRIDDHDRLKISFSGRRDSTTTSPDGSFRLVGLDAGKYRINAITDDSERFEFKKGKTPPSKAEVELDLSAAAVKTAVVLTIEAHDGVIRGTVLGPDKEPAADAWVTAHRVREKIEDMPEQFASRRWGGSTPVLTNGNGQFTISKLQRGAYDLVIEGPRGASHAEKPGVKAGESTTIQLLSLGTLAGRVTLAGAPVTKYKVECKGEDGDRERQVEAKDGAYSLERLAPGSYRCEVDSDAGIASAKVNVVAGPTQHDFTLTRWATLTGVVVSVLDKKPVPGVMVFAGNDFSERRFMAALMGEAPKTDASGRFVIQRVAIGKGKALVMPTEGFQPLGTRDYTAAEGQPVDLGTIEIVPPRIGDAGTFGIATDVDGDKLLVSSVKEGGPAANAGVQVGDRITAINGRDVAALTLPIASLLLQSGNIGVAQSATLTLDRAGAPAQASLVSVKW